MTALPRLLVLPLLVFVAIPAWAEQQASTPAPPKPAEAKPAARETGVETSGKQAKTYTLRYRLAPGDTLRYEADHRASVRSTMEGTTQKATTRTVSVKAWRVTDVLPNGQIELLHTVERLRMANKLPEQAEQTYDSQKDATPGPGFADAAKTVGAPLSRVRITPWGALVKRDELQNQPAADPYAPVSVLLPEGPVAIGDSWDEPQEISVRLPDSQGTKAIKTRRHMTLVSVDNGVAEIRAEHQVLTPVTAPIEAQLAQRLMSGTIRFDLPKGRIVSQQMKVDKRVLGFAGQTSSMHYVMQMRERLVTGDRVASKKNKAKK